MRFSEYAFVYKILQAYDLIIYRYNYNWDNNTYCIQIQTPYPYTGLRILPNTFMCIIIAKASKSLFSKVRLQRHILRHYNLTWVFFIISLTL